MFDLFTVHCVDWVKMGLHDGYNTYVLSITLQCSLGLRQCHENDKNVGAGGDIVNNFEFGARVE